MKNIKKFLSLLLVLAMVFAMSSSVFATEATSSGTVTVSVTYNKFTKGGIDANGNAVAQAYKGGTPTMADANANYYILNYEMSIDDIKELVVDGLIRDSVYNAPAGLQVNVLDAIIAAFYNHDVYVIEGGWDANPVEGPAGGYIHYVEGQNITYNPTRQEVVNGITYDVFSGTGWTIACTQNGELTALSLYGTSYELVDGMEIVFDISEYEIYYPAA